MCVTVAQETKLSLSLSSRGPRCLTVAQETKLSLIVVSLGLCKAVQRTLNNDLKNNLTEKDEFQMSSRFS